MNDNMKTLVNINSHTLTQQLTQLEKAVKSLANQTKFLAATASAISKTVSAHEIELRDLHPVKAAHDRGRWCVLYEWAGIRHDGLRALRDAAVHGGDITTDTRLLSSPIDESEENVEALRAAFREHYGIDLKTASGNIATAPPYVVEACDVLADVRSLGFWRERVNSSHAGMQLRTWVDRLSTTGCAARNWMAKYCSSCERNIVAKQESP